MSGLLQRLAAAERMAKSVITQLEQLRAEVEAEADTVPAAVLASVCTALGVSQDDVLDRQRTADVVRARSATALALHRRGFSLSRIGRAIGLYHSTVANSVRRAEAKVAADKDFARAVAVGEQTAGRFAPPRRAA